MKIDVTVVGSLVQRRGPRGAADAVRAETSRRIAADLQRELDAIFQSEDLADADPETRRDALERAVRRIWGATI